MAKDRFNRRSNWDMGFKYSGQLMPKESSTPKEPITPNQYEVLTFLTNYKNYLTDWEKNFIKTCIINNIKLTTKQGDVIRQMVLKVNRLELAESIT